jgi:hypothetical protein
LSGARSVGWHGAELRNIAPDMITGHSAVERVARDGMRTLERGRAECPGLGSETSVDVLSPQLTQLAGAEVGDNVRGSETRAGRDGNGAAVHQPVREPVSNGRRDGVDAGCGEQPVFVIAEDRLEPTLGSGLDSAAGLANDALTSRAVPDGDGSDPPVPGLVEVHAAMTTNAAG